MLRNRKDLGKPFSPSKGRKALSKSFVGRSPRRCLSTSFASSSRGVRVGKHPSSVGGASANMKVVVRVRPFSQREVQSNASPIVKVVDEKMLVFDPKEEDTDFFYHGNKQRGRDMLKKQNKNCEFLFDRVFGPEATNEDVFQASTMSIVSSVLDGFNCSVFVYGATGAGKTYTMLGSEENPGITFRTMVELFRQVEVQGNEKEFDIRVSYLEVYNENVHDLLHPGGPLHLREDGGGGVVVAGLKMEQILNPHRMFELLEHGNKNRSQHPTDANAESSRSHAVFQVFIRMTTKSTGQTKLVKLSMIDLAGSERGAATGCAGARFKEGSNINKSLLALGNCINALADGHRHIPYRDSKLTRILKDSLGGNCQTVMIANVSPAHATIEDTHNTLKYARRAKAIKVKITRNIVTVQLHVSNYIKMNEDLQRENLNLKEEVRKLKEELAQSKREIQLCEGAFKSECAPAPLSYVSSEATLDSSTSRPPILAAATNGSEEAFSDILKKAEKLFKEKALLQKRYLNLDSSEKVLHIQMYLKERSFDRVQALSSTPCRKEAMKARVERSLGQFNGRLTSANQCQEILDHKKDQIDKQLEILKEDAKKLNLLHEFTSRLEGLQLMLSKRELSVQCEHYEKLVQILSKGIESQDKFINEISEVFRHYYNLLRGHGLMTEKMLDEYNTLMRHSEGIKSVNWIPDSILSSSNDSAVNHPEAFQAISKQSAKLSFDSQMSPLSDVCETSDSVLSTPKILERLTDNLVVKVPNSLRNDTTDSLSKIERHQFSPSITQNTNSSPTPLKDCSKDISELPLPDNAEQMKGPSYQNSPISYASKEQSRATSSLPQPIEQSPQPLCMPASGVSDNMDTASMLDSLGQLNSKVENLLNTSIPQSNHIEDELCYPTLNSNGTLPSLNSTFDASDKFSSTLNKDIADLTRAGKKHDNLNVTFEKLSRSQSPCADSDALNSTFSLSSPSISPKLAPLIPDVATEPSPIQSQLTSVSPKATISLVSPTHLPNSNGTIKKPYPVSGELSISQATSTKVTKLSPSLGAMSTSPDVASTKISKASPVFAVPSIPPNKPRSAMMKPLEETSQKKRKAILPHASSAQSSSSKPLILNRKPIGAALKMKTTPSKVKALWNKENRNTVLSSLTGTLKTSGSSKFSSSVGATKNQTKYDISRKVLNDTYTKASPK